VVHPTGHLYGQETIMNKTIIGAAAALSVLGTAFAGVPAMAQDGRYRDGGYYRDQDRTGQYDRRDYRERGDYRDGRDDRREYRDRRDDRR
jgi:hypothetical protein